MGTLTAEVELWVTRETAKTVLCLSRLEDQKCAVIIHCHTSVRYLIALFLHHIVIAALWHFKRSSCVCTVVALQ